MKLIKLITIFLLLFYEVDAFGQRMHQEDIYGYSGGGDAGIFGWLALIIFVGLVAWGVVTDRSFRLGVLAYFAYIGSLIFIFKIFGKEAGIVACVISIIALWLTDPSRQKSTNSDFEKDNISINKDKKSEIHKADKYKTSHSPSFDNAEYPSNYSEKLSSTDHNQTSYPHTSKLNISEKPIKLFDGNIKCGCGFQDLHSNFLESDAGSLFKKCPKCNSHIQILSESRFSLGAHKCPGCGYSGDVNAFFPSSAGQRFLKCPGCNTHFEH